ncbi:MAG: kelch repeat-containing protein [Bryobacteraceae bacterium]
MPLPEAGGAAGFVGGELILAGGTAWDGDTKLWLKEVQIYTPAKDSWRAGPPLPRGTAYGPFVHSTGGLEIFGGTDGKQVHRESWKLNSAKTAWESTGTVPADVLLGAAALAAGDVFLFGGCPDAADLTRCSEAVWKRSSGEWHRVSKLPGGPMALSAIASVGGQIYLFGGCSMPVAGQVLNHAEAYKYDPRENAWTTLHNLPSASRGLSAVAVDERYIYLLGGYGTTFSSDVLVYDTQSGSYQKASSLPVPLMATPFVRDGRKLYGAGGEDRPKGRSARMLVGDLAK